MIPTRRSAGARAASVALLLLAAAACGGERAADGAADSGVAGGGAPGTATDTTTPTPSVLPTDSAGGAGGAGAATDSAARGALLDPNTATREQLVAVPGMTAAAADALVAGRPYADMVAVNRVLAAQVPDSAARKTIYAQVWRPIDLNTAKGEEILLIPGVGRKMRHEFEEYRPYRDMARFRREIGKYADSAEVARLARYVTIR
jgi:DNA uptake protein ComE-like DNA-binding protein